jgi:Zn-finger nucleic acid-binding protein
MVEVSIQDRASDETTSANAGILRIGKVSAALPNKFATTAELNATRMVGTKDTLPGEVVVSAKLMYPDSLKKVLKEDAPLRDFARRLSREAGGFEDVARLVFLIFRGEASYSDAEDLRTLLDLQYFADMDVVTVQQASGMSPEDFASLLRFAQRWMDQKGLDKPIMPVIQASETQREFELFSAPAVKGKSRLLGVDMRGGFHYYTLRAVENIKKKNPGMWIHAFQVPPKIRFARRMLSSSQGMLMPYFGVDSYSRWVVPPPPVPLTKDKINVFDKSGWGVFKRKEWRGLHGKKLTCACPMCKGQNLDGFYVGKVLTVLSRSKIHDHYAQQDELKKTSESIRKHEYTRLIKTKKYANMFVSELKKSLEAETKP